MHSANVGQSNSIKNDNLIRDKITKTTDCGLVLINDVQRRRLNQLPLRVICKTKHSAYLKNHLL